MTTSPVRPTDSRPGLPGSAALAEICQQLTAAAKGARPAAIELAAGLARALQQRANELQTPEERRQQAELDRMMQNPSDESRSLS